MDDVLTRIGNLGIVPVIAMDDAENAGPLADALIAGGLPLAEITFRTDAAERAVREMARRPGLLVGAGTVLNVETAKRAAGAGAKFIISPGFNSKVVRWCLANHILVTPGTATPTDIELALDHGLTVVKFFPAEALGGINMLKAIAAPYAMMRFIPTGGITPENLAAYLKLPSILACGGSWIAARETIAARRFDEITALARQAVQLVEQRGLAKG
ncbi:MAG TPA: bifunctional 4-hydroxy-2-oxoglutarate aldolase/2-dehydro-3-deoxy-phosphogluconate aldolase [Tepidisphaeraceae bacterium]|nr:bifunctional 4-hydroxy-2-oxoglutarate aldolase/2-dehydro-3-deoxy-phosphogluconate aldolase [Tepidisphaeraceae bacterium]